MELLIERLASIDFSLLGVVFAGLISAYKVYCEWDKKNRMQFILDHLPGVYLLAKKAAKATTDIAVDDHYVDIFGKLLRGFGWDLKEDEAESIKLQGSAFHQLAKEMDADPLDEG